jgi:hypothetical protein
VDEVAVLLAFLEEELDASAAPSEPDASFLLFDDRANLEVVVLIIFLPVSGDNTADSSLSVLRLFVIICFFMTLPFKGATSTSSSLTGFTIS